MKFQTWNFLKIKNIEILALLKFPSFFDEGMKAKWQDGGRRILLGHNTGCRAAMLELIEFHIGGDCISTGFHCMYTYVWPYNSQFRLELNSTCAGFSGRQGAWTRVCVCTYSVKNTVLWIVTSYSLENIYQHFGGTKCLCFLPRRCWQRFLPQFRYPTFLDTI